MDTKSDSPNFDALISGGSENRSADSSAPAPSAGSSVGSGAPIPNGAGSPSIASAAPVAGKGTAAAAPGVGSVSIPRAPGRPRKDGQQPRSHHTAGETRKPAAPDKTALKDAEAKKTADTILTVAETLAMALAGDEAKFQPSERYLLDESLPQVLATLTPAAAAQIQQFAAPAMLGTGAILYVVRVATLVLAKAQTEREQRQRRAALVPAPTAPNVSTPAAPFAPDSGITGAAPVLAQSLVPAESLDALASKDGRHFVNVRGIDG